MVIHFFRYCLLLGVYIIPIYFLMEDTEKFPVLFFGFLAITIGFWGALWFISKKNKNKK